MNELARFVYGLISGKKAQDINLSETECKALVDLGPVLQGHPDDLGRWLAQGHMPQENWLTPPPIVTD